MFAKRCLPCFALASPVVSVPSSLVGPALLAAGSLATGVGLAMANQTASDPSEGSAEDQEDSGGEWFWGLVQSCREAIIPSRAMALIGGVALVTGGVAYMFSSEEDEDKGQTESREEIECAKASAQACKGTVRKMESKVKQLEQRVLELEDCGFDAGSICVVCMENQRDCVFSPCRHAIVCSQCCQEMQSHFATYECPVCRTPIEKSEKIRMI